MAILSVRNLSMGFINKDLFNDISFFVEEGDKIGLVGLNGSGKTSLFKLLMGEIFPNSGEISYQNNIKKSYLRQHTQINSKNTIFDECLEVFDHVFSLEKEIRDMEIKISNLTEDSMDSQVLLNQYARLSERYSEIKGDQVNSRITGVLRGLGFVPEDFDKIIDHLSGGQKSRVQLAKLLLSSPDFMLLDEPTNHLDINAITWLENYLRDYKGTIMVISHDRFFLDKLVNRIFLIENKELFTYNGNYTNYQKLHEKELEIRQRHYENRKAAIEREREIVERYLSVGKANIVRQGQSRLKKLEKMEALSPVQLEKLANIKFETTVKTGFEVFIGENLSKSFGDKLIFENINFKVYNGDRIGIIGGNGVGKTTLFNIIAKKLESDSGNLVTGSNVIIGYFDQEMSDLDPNNSIIDEIWDAYPKLDHFHIRSYLAKMNFTGDKIFDEISTLSGGEKSRISLLKLMMSNANVLLMDEPTNHLDIESKEILEKALKDYNGTVISISHDRYFLNNFAFKIWEMSNDEIIEYLGNYDYYLSKKESLEKPIENQDMETLTQKKNRQKEERKLREEKRKEKQKVKKILDEIHILEEEIHNLELEMADPKVAKNYEVLLELDQEKSKLEEKKEKLYEEWMELEE